MVTLYRRHQADCKYSRKAEPRKFKDCTCPVHKDGWMTNAIGERVVMRGSMETRNWGHATIKLNAQIEPFLKGEEFVKDITVQDAVSKFLKAKATDIPAKKTGGKMSDAVVAFRTRTGY